MAISRNRAPRAPSNAWSVVQTNKCSRVLTFAIAKLMVARVVRLVDAPLHRILAEQQAIP